MRPHPSLQASSLYDADLTYNVSMRRPVVSVRGNESGAILWEDRTTLDLQCADMTKGFGTYVSP